MIFWIVGDGKDNRGNHCNALELIHKGDLLDEETYGRNNFV